MNRRTAMKQAAVATAGLTALRIAKGTDAQETSRPYNPNPHGEESYFWAGGLPVYLESYTKVVPGTVPQLHDIHGRNGSLEDPSLGEEVTVFRVDGQIIGTCPRAEGMNTLTMLEVALRTAERTNAGLE